VYQCFFIKKKVKVKVKVKVLYIYICHAQSVNGPQEDVARVSYKRNREVENIDHLTLLGPAPAGTGTLAFDPTFGSFTLLELISH